ncbi:saccharopine dehydrogenase-like oxidoreductase [Acomys russatus]|uniref:saccharopine dehydrogenase-like oxidoreductase n=1 Tax=Acomys russatus TaxID=60746 RepID=UPI0021E2C6DB|nr:saccharopine dehydrogenase-like oxidoreductase [Acomys russatus]
MATEQRPFRLVVFGASGFTGQFVTEEVAREQVTAGQSSRLPWAVAGRSKEKLQQVLEAAGQKLGRPTLSSEVGIIICDITNPASLDEMAKKATLVLNCVGPYRFYGEPVVKACIENGTSCIDICGEPQFLELMHVKYHEKAAEKGVYIIGSSGFDSIPADLGVLYTRNQMNGTLTAVESFLTIHSGPEGLCIHDGTWKSAIYGFGDKGSLRKLRSTSCLKPVPIVGSKLKRRWPVSYCRELSSYSIPFLGSDMSVVKRTQRYLHENLEDSPVQYAAYVTVGGITSVIKLMFAGLFFLFFVKFSIGRQLLVKFPWLFSFGYFSKQGPTQKQMEGSSFTMTFFGQGYSHGFSAEKNKPNIRICTQVKGPEAGYVATPIAMVQAAMTFLNDASDLPKGGGVFTPGAAFSRTKLIDRLNQHGIEFSVISSSEV